MPIYDSGTMSNRLLGSSFTVQTTSGEGYSPVLLLIPILYSRSRFVQLLTRFQLAGIFMEVGEETDPTATTGPRASHCARRISRTILTGKVLAHPDIS